jgi:PAT family beta-lactamase induction signal transducer AmpG
MFALLYFVQGAALAYFTNFQKPYLDSFGIDADVIGLLTSILLLPFILKIFIGMVSDRVSLFGAGHRKPYMLLGLALATLAFGATAFVLPSRSFTLFAALILLGSFSVTLFDSTTDGLAIDITPHDQHGIVQGAMVGGRAVGLILLSLVFGWLAGQGGGYSAVFLIIAASMLIPLLMVLLIREPAERSASQTFDWRAFGALARPRFLLFAAYAILYSIASFGVNGLITYHMSKTFAAPDTLIGVYGAIRGVGAAVGALGAGMFIDRIGRRVSAYGALAAISIFAALIGLAPSLNLVIGLGVVWGLAWGFQETVFVALAMDLSDARIAASMFAIMMALSNLGTAVGEGVATSLTDNIGFAGVFLALAAFNLITFPALWGLFRAAPDITARSAGAGEANSGA